MKPLHFSADTLALIRLMDEHDVRALLIGGEAVIYYGYPRLTGDVDFFFSPDAENAERLFAALREFWDGDVPAIGSAAELSAPRLVVQFGRPPNRIELINDLGPVSFDDAWTSRTPETIDVDGRRCSLHVIGLRELIAAKRHAGRHKDLDDIEHLPEPD